MIVFPAKELGKKIDLKRFVYDFPPMSFVLDLHDPKCEYIKESINSDFLIRIPDNCRNLDKCYFEIAEKIVENLNYDPSVDEGMWTKLTIDAFIYSMLKFFDSNLDVCCTITPTFNYGKKPDISVYWSNEHFHTTVCLMEASSRPFAAPDMLKKEGDW
ncbi:11628_t:CDS:2 [Entrophospora sp. SA101]|nr:11628_t:CDS:2 [Entrophospora sp. SA101]